MKVKNNDKQSQTALEIFKIYDVKITTSMDQPYTVLQLLRGPGWLSLTVIR